MSEVDIQAAARTSGLCLAKGKTYRCTLPAAHASDHEAANSATGEVYDTWPRGA